MISICMPVHNEERTLAKVIRSILAQTYTDWELIIVDDGSTDSTPRILKYYAIDPKIKVITTKNKGISSARKTAFENSKGDYICINDGDVIMDTERLRTSMDAIGDVDIVYSGWMVAEYPDDAIDMPDDINEVTDIKQILGDKVNQYVPNFTIMARRKCFDDDTYREEFKVNDDLWTVVKWWKKGYKFKLIREYLAYHVFGTNHVSDDNLKEVQGITEQIKKEEL